MTNVDFIIESFDETIARINTWKDRRQSHGVVSNNNKDCCHLMAVEMEKGFFIRGRDYILREETKFHTTTKGNTGAPLFMISFLLTPESILIETGYEWPSRKIAVKKQSNIVFASGHSGISFIVKAACHVKAMDVCFTSAWLMQQLTASKRLKVQELLTEWERKKHVSIGSLSIQHHMIINEMVDQLNSRETDILYLKSRALLLMNELIERLISENETAIADTPANVATIIEIEKKISSILHQRMPDLKTIAREHSMSESTLKRQFKKVYGKAVYKYHLSKKMALAEQLLRRGDLTVTQIAYTLGYEKVSSFIKVFKKEFFISPGVLKSQLQGGHE